MTTETLDSLTELDFDLIQMSEDELDAFATAQARGVSAEVAAHGLAPLRAVRRPSTRPRRGRSVAAGPFERAAA